MYWVCGRGSQTIPITAGCTRADHLVAQAPSQAWKRLSCGAGAKGPRLFDWAVASLPTYPWTTTAGWSRWLLARRALTPNSKGELEIAYYLCCAPTGTSEYIRHNPSLVVSRRRDRPELESAAAAHLPLLLDRHRRHTHSIQY